MAIIELNQKSLAREELLLKKVKATFCTDCVIDWCKIRNQVSYCSQKYRGTSCYSCTDNSCTKKRIAGS